VDVPDGTFQYTKLASVGSFFNWGLIELRADQMKRSKNSRKMHMVFNVQSGTVEVRLHENEFTVHKGGIWQVPRGKSYTFFILLSTPSFAIRSLDIDWPAKYSACCRKTIKCHHPRLCKTVVTQCVERVGILYFQNHARKDHLTRCCDDGSGTNETRCSFSAAYDMWRCLAPHSV
jgi:hypothetical protein